VSGAVGYKIDENGTGRRSCATEAANAGVDPNYVRVPRGSAGGNNQLAHNEVRGVKTRGKWGGRKRFARAGIACADVEDVGVLINDRVSGEMRPGCRIESVEHRSPVRVIVARTFHEIAGGEERHVTAVIAGAGLAVLRIGK